MIIRAIIATDRRHRSGILIRTAFVADAANLPDQEPRWRSAAAADPGAFAPFGDVIDMPTAGRPLLLRRRARQPAPSATASLSVDAQGCRRPTGRSSPDMLERHEFSSQSFIPVDVGRWLIVVAPHARRKADRTGARRSPSSPTAAGVTYKANTWHHGLTTLDKPGSFAVFMWKAGARDEEFVPVEPFTVKSPELRLVLRHPEPKVSDSASSSHGSAAVYDRVTMAIVVRDWRTTEAALGRRVRTARRRRWSRPRMRRRSTARAISRRCRTRAPGIPRRRLHPGRRLRRRAGLCAGLPARRGQDDLDGADERQDRRHRPADGRRTGKETDMSWQPNRDFWATARTRPIRKWPNGARLAVNFVMNYEEGSEPSVQDGEGYTETGLTKSTTSAGRHERPRPRRRRHVRVRQPGRLLAPDARLPGARPADDGVRLRAGARAQPAGRRGDQDVGLRCLQPRLALDQALHAERGGGARAHRQGGEVVPADCRPVAGRLVLPLWTLGQHAPPAHRAWRLHLRQRLLRRRAAVLADRRRASRTSSSPTRSPTTTASTPTRWATPTSGSAW